MPNSNSSFDLTAITNRFEQDGFAVIDGIAGPACVEELGAVYDGMIDGSIPCPGTDRQLGDVTRQIMTPHVHHPAFKASEAYKNAKEIAASLLGTDQPYFTFSMLIFKPAGHPHTTPWHTDLSYTGQPFAAAGTQMPENSAAQFWLALDDVDETMGCMEFIPGVQDDPMPEHYVFSGDPNDDGRLLAIKDPETNLDLSKAVKCPVKAGSATVHSYSTPHFTGPNSSADKDRRAFIMNFINLDRLNLAAE